MSSSPHASTISLASNDRKPPAPQKDYAAAFANLQSSYGAGGHAPVQATQTGNPIASDKAKIQRARRATLAKRTENEAAKTEPQLSSSHQKKTFKGIFAAFRTSCGFGRSSPSASR